VPLTRASALVTLPAILLIPMSQPRIKLLRPCLVLVLVGALGCGGITIVYEGGDGGRDAQLVDVTRNESSTDGTRPDGTDSFDAADAADAPDASDTGMDGVADTRPSDVSTESATDAACPPAASGVVTLASGLTDPYDLAVGASSVFWSDPAANTISSVSLADCSVTVIASGQDNPVGVTLDSTYVYWTNGDEGDSSGSIVRAPLSGGSSKTLATGLSSPGMLVNDGTNLYWMADLSTSYVLQMPIGGGTVQTLASSGYSVNLVVYGSAVYWADEGDDAVLSVPVGGGSVSTLAGGQSSPFGIATDGTYIYFTEAIGSGAIVRTPIPAGGSLFSLASSLDSPTTVATDGVSAFFEAGGSVYGVPVDGSGSVTALAAGNPTRLRMDSKSLYWTESTSGLVLRLVSK
jgi:Domain of unknown function (DUF5050)